ncbi:MAG: hypothetical protein HC866_14645 [Leptolyngbyaceae cyanobacterium RU_5_1]|nr:hypothetical protein [Leptolyngbyaceae cyanobacterium RU_5_1]
MVVKCLWRSRGCRSLRVLAGRFWIYAALKSGTQNLARSLNSTDRDRPGSQPLTGLAI